MRAAIVTTPIGVFVVDDKNEIVEYVKFPKSASKIAEKLQATKQSIIAEEKMAMRAAKKRGFEEFSFPAKKRGVKYVDKGKEQFVKENLRKLALEHKFADSQAELNKLLTDVNIALTKAEIRESIQRDSIVVQVNCAIEELDKSTNILVERLREWYGIHFPEMDRVVANHEKFVKLVEKFGQRDKMEEEELKQLAENSMGIELADKDVKELQGFAHSIHELYDSRERLSKYLKAVLEEVAPNFTELAGPMIAAKLIAKAGGLKKLARMPSSTIQLLGSEKALFRHLHGRGKPPKHGIIVTHPLLQNAPKEMKGKIARLLASKLSIAAKLDYYSKKDQSKKLKKELQEKIKEIIKKK